MSKERIPRYRAKQDISRHFINSLPRDRSVKAGEICECASYGDSYYFEERNGYSPFVTRKVVELWDDLFEPLPATLFVMRGYDKDTINKYDCSLCKRRSITHEVVTIPGGHTNGNSWCGPGIPTTKRRCTGCGYEDGPWVSSDIVGGCW
jgi:hypothetical protein